MRAAWSCIIALLLTGCADSSPHEAPIAPLEGAFARVPFLEAGTLPATTVFAQLIPLGEATFEPAAVVSADGTRAFVIGIHLNASSSMWAMGTNATTWTELGDVSPPEDGTQDASLSIGADGVAWLADLQGPRRGEGAFCTLVGTLSPGTTQFGPRERVCSSVLTVDRPWISATPTGAIVVQRNTMGSVEIFEDGGTGWTTTPLPSLYFTVPGPVSASDFGTAFAAANDQRLASDAPHPGGIFIAYRQHGAKEWDYTRLSAGNLQGRWPIAALSSDDAGIVAWAESRATIDPQDELGVPFGGPYDVRLATRAGGAWSDAQTIDSTGANGHVWAAAAVGHKVVTWLHTETIDDAGSVPRHAEWRVRFWIDGHTFETQDPVWVGPLGRELGDFIGSGIFPDSTVLFPLQTSEGTTALLLKRAVPR